MPSGDAVYGEHVTAIPRAHDQWLLAGQALLRRGGAGAVKLQALTDHLGLTTGSFYHHFTGMADYLDQLARHYGAGQVTLAMASVDDPDPATRLRRLVELSRDERMGPLDTAMRDWAGTNPVAAESVRAADEALLRFIERAFRDLGHATAEARTRALLLFSTGVARVHPPWPVPGRILDRVLDVLVPVPPAAPPPAPARAARPAAPRP
jgi:AcrR family transcriptional regulator